MYHIVDKASGKVLVTVAGSMRQAQDKASKIGIHAIVKFASGKPSSFMQRVGVLVNSWEAEQAGL